jgi:hypothetical protein
MSGRSTQSKDDIVPEITLRIPGPWESPKQLLESLAAINTGWVIAPPVAGEEMCLLHEPTGRRFKLGAVVADAELAELFAESGRMDDRELDALREHIVKVFVTGPGGSLEAAKTFLEIGAAFIGAGALGVMVDNSGLCHSPKDWLALAGDADGGGTFWGFVTLSASPREIFSAGMHCIGYRDVELPDPVDRQTGGMIVGEFLGYSYRSEAQILDGDPIGGPDGPQFILRHVECTRFPKDSPWYNPYGVWRLEKFEAGADN